MKKQPQPEAKNNLSTLQANAEAATKQLKSARTSLASAKLSVDRAEAAYATAQNAFQSGVEQVKHATKVL